jgi:hypothetical protein
MFMRSFSLLLVCMGACGGRTVLEDTEPTPHDTHTTSDASATLQDGGKPDHSVTSIQAGCAVVLDVRMCTPKCTQFDCCETLYDAKGAPAGVGICWIDRNTQQLCNTSCEACVHKEPGLDICVPAYLCTGLRSLSGIDPCFKPK